MKRWMWELIDFAALVLLIAVSVAFVIVLAAMMDKL